MREPRVKRRTVRIGWYYDRDVSIRVLVVLAVVGCDPKLDIVCQAGAPCARATPRQEAIPDRTGGDAPGEAAPRPTRALRLAASATYYAARHDCGTATALAKASLAAGPDARLMLSMDPNLRACAHPQPTPRELAWAATKAAIDAAYRGDCGAVAHFADEVRALDRELHDTAFARNAAIARCLAP